MNVLDSGQPWIPKGERSGLQTRTATMGKRFVVHADEKLTAFVELEAAIKSVALLMPVFR